MNYKEEVALTEKVREEYLREINELITQRENQAAEKRKEYIENILSNPEKYRNDFRKMLGWPLVDYNPQGLPKAEFTELSRQEGYTIYRAKIEIVNGVYMAGLFFKRETEEPLPMIITQHGGLGTPEFIANFYPGDTSNYNDMFARVFKYKVHAFAPQLLLWNTEIFKVPFDRKEIDCRLKRVGSSITALEVYGIIRILDYFEKEDYVSNFGMVGLSYGGFYTIYTTAIDTRIKSAISCSFFNDRDKICWSDWSWQNSQYMFNDAEVAALCYPRRLCIQMGDKDELFDYKYTEGSFKQLKEICKDREDEKFELIIFDGVHEFYKGDEPIEKLINDLK